MTMFRETLNKANPEKTFTFPERFLRSYLITNLCQTISVAINNHLELNLVNRLAKYLKNIKDESDGAKAKYWAERIMNIRIPSPEYKSKFDDDPVSEALIKEFRELLKIDHKKIIAVSDNVDIYLPIYYKFLKQFEDTKSKLFSLLPQKGEFGENYIKIDTSALINLLSQITEKRGLSTIKMSEKKQKWKDYFNLNLVETQKFRFADEIVTNGYDVSITMKQQIKDFPVGYDLNWDLKRKAEFVKNIHDANQKLKADKSTKTAKKSKKAKTKTIPAKLQNLGYEDYLTILGLDPGRRSLYTVFEPESEKKFDSSDKSNSRVHKCSAKEWRHLTGLTRDLKWRNKKKDKSPLIKGLNQISFKTSNAQLYLENLKNMIPKLDDVLKFYGQTNNKKRRFTRYIKTQKAYNQIIERMHLGKDDNKAIIGFGNGATNSNGACKGAKVPGKSLYRKICHHTHDIICDLVDEQYTSKMCSVCYSTLEYIYKWKEITKNNETIKVKARVYGLLRCQNNECGITWDRDINASRNIHNIVVALLKGEERPEYLTRKFAQKKRAKVSKTKKAKATS